MWGVKTAVEFGSTTALEVRKVLIYLWAILFLSCSDKDPVIPVHQDKDSEAELSDTELLELTQRETFRYFWDFAEVNSGAARERFHPNNPEMDSFTVTTGGSGFGLMAIITGIERGYITRSEAVTRLNKTLSFFKSADRFHGAWPHWIDGRSGRVIPFSPKDNGGDLVETAFLVQGLICLYEYFKAGNDLESDLAQTAYTLWKEVEWDWYTQGQSVLYWHWSPDFGFEMNMPLRGYNETLITYILAAAAPDYGIRPEVYQQGWAQNGAIQSEQSAYGYSLGVNHVGNQSRGGPLFWAHYSFLGLNPNNLSDTYSNYELVARNHARINYEYCLENPKNFVAYGSDCWGLTASYTRNSDGGIGYAAHSPSNDLGVISPTAALASMPYMPEESMRAMRYFYNNRKLLLGPAGFYDAFSPQQNFWVAQAYLAIDQGPIVIMIENFRSGLLWNLFGQNEDVKNGIQLLEFKYEN
ncbi:MAG: hypothetical protein RLZZ241_2327 [Bacteroidota bacterium]